MDSAAPRISALTQASRIAVLTVLTLILIPLLGPSCAPPPASFPSRPGEAAQHAEDFQNLSVRYLRVMGSGAPVEVARVEHSIVQFQDQAVSLVVRAVPAAGGLRLGGRFEVGSSSTALPDLECRTPSNCVSQEWLELELSGPTGAARSIRRELYDARDGPYPGYRRYTIVAVSDVVAPQEVEVRIQRTVAALKVDERRAQVTALQAGAKDAKPAEAQALVSQLEDLDVGGSVAHLVALGFAAQSDVLTERLAKRVGVHPKRLVPRILITSATAEGQGNQLSFSLDLRVDEVETSATDDPNAARAFQLSRGIQESTLESSYLKAMTGVANAVSTAALMTAAARSAVSLIALAPSQRDRLPTALPTRFAALIHQALDRGHQVILPQRAVALAGKSRWGFWDIDPDNGRTIGVMEGGQHQGIVSVSLTHQAVLDPAAGFVLGLQSGMVNGHFGLAALILKYGEVTPQLIDELKQVLSTAACSACPEVKAAGSISIKVGECWKKDLVSLKVGGGDFCSSFQDGFLCAAGLILSSLEGNSPVEVEGEVSNPSLVIGCSQVPLG